MAVQLKNNAATTLAADITSSATSIPVADGSVFPALSGSGYTYVTFEDTNSNREIVKVTGISSNTLTVVRAQDNTTARAFSNGDKCELRITAALLNDIATQADTDTNTTYTAGSGLTLAGTEFSNSAPDQTVALTGAGATTISGTYPNFTISSTDTNTDTNTEYTAGTNLSLSGTTFNVSGSPTFSGTVTATDLALSDSTNPLLTITDTTNTTTLFLEAANSSTTVGTSTDHPLKFDTNNTERLRIGSAGQIGLSGANYGTSGQVLTSNGGSSAPTWQDASGIDGTTINPSAVQIGGTTVIDSSRDLAVSTASIGGATNSFALNVYHPTTNVVARFESGDGNVWIDLRDSNSGTYGALLGHDSTNLFKVADSSVDDKLTLSNAGLLDTDAGYSVGSTTVIDSSRNLVNINSVEIGDKVTLSESTDRADLLQITGTTSVWAGLQIRNSGGEGRWSFMTDGAMAGIYDDENGDWYMQFNELGATEIFHNSVQKLTTTTGGVTVTGLVTADRFLSGLGTSASPAFQVGDTNTGLYDSGANTIGVACNGAHEFDFDASRLDMKQNRLDNVSEIQIVDSNTKLIEGSGNAVRIQTNSGYVDIGSQNTSWAHMTTDRPAFYFSKGLTVNTGVFSSYDEDAILRRAGSTTNQITISTTGVNIAGSLSLVTSATDARYLHLPRGGGITLYGDASTHHGIFSRNSSNTAADDILISSYGAVYFDLDSNSNNSSAANFEITRHSGTAAIFKVDGENSNVDFTGSLFMPSYLYHSGDTNSYIRFVAADDMQLVAGGRQMIRMDEGTNPDRLYFPNGSSYTDSNGTAVFAGNVTAYASDRRLKTNITPIKNALDKVMAIRGVTYDWIDEVEDLGFTPDRQHDCMGVIAQELEEAGVDQVIMPAPFDRIRTEETDWEDVSKSGEEYKTVDYDKLTALLIEAVKEQQGTIKSLQQRIDQLEGLV